MDVTSTSAATTPTTAATKTKATEEETASSTLTGDFDTFLKLLTTQLKNQDPLQPMDSTEFVAQLASFSSVEQQIGSNTRLDKILAALSGASTESFANWIGKEVRAPTSADFTGAAVEIFVTPVEDADRAVLVVKNDFGQEVARQSVTVGEESVIWDGNDSLGNGVAHGRYAFALESYAGETLVDTQAGQVFATVAEVRVDAENETVLVLDGGGQVAPGDVTAVR